MTTNPMTVSGWKLRCSFDGLRACAAEDDAILIFEAGHDKLRYVGGGVTIITAKGVEYINLEESARKIVRELLGNEQWDTRCSC